MSNFRLFVQRLFEFRVRYVPATPMRVHAGTREARRRRSAGQIVIRRLGVKDRGLRQSLSSGRASRRPVGLQSALRSMPSFDHLVGEQLHRVRHLDAKGLRGLQVDDELELARLHDGKIGRPLAFENATDEVSGLTI